MANDLNGRKNFPPNMIRLCIDEYYNDMKGRIYSRIQCESIEFNDCCEMLLQVDEMFDKHGYPQAFCESRSFKEKENKCCYSQRGILQQDEEKIVEQHGKLCTLDILVQSRRKVSWQGMIWHIDESKKYEFYSEMEFLRKINEIIRKNLDSKEQKKTNIKSYRQLTKRKLMPKERVVCR